jgi:hypothetical protein
MFSCQHLIYSMHIRQFLLCISKYSVKIFNSLLLEQLLIWMSIYMQTTIISIADCCYVHENLVLHIKSRFIHGRYLKFKQADQVTL